MNCLETWGELQWENGYSESFNARFREELLNRELIYNVREAKVMVENYRVEHNEERLHSSLDDLTPQEFKELWYEQNTITALT